MLIKKKMVTQAKAAEACNIPVSTMRGWMTKNIVPPLEDAWYLSRYLGVSLEYLINGKETDAAVQLENILVRLDEMNVNFRKIREISLLPKV